MRVFLLYPDRDFPAEQPLEPNEKTLEKDLGIETILDAMAAGDDFVRSIGKMALLQAAPNSIETITYRQAILQDAIENPDTMRKLYELTIESLDAARHTWFGIFTQAPTSIFSSSVSSLKAFLESLGKLREITREAGPRFRSTGFRRFFDSIVDELSDEYLSSVETHLLRLGSRNGVILSARLGDSNQGSSYIFRKENFVKRSRLDRFFKRGPETYTFSLHPRDEAGGRILTEMQDDGVNEVANALAQSGDHLSDFFKVLQREVAFYIGCANLHNRLHEFGLKTCFPEPKPLDSPHHAYTVLYDMSLGLILQGKVVSNDLDAGEKRLFVITGANQGGKSSFLRAIGLAQLLMQCGCFVGAEKFSANLCRSLFTHYKREEDATHTHGKLDEELSRMNEIVTQIQPRSLFLFNESFAATNEREGSEIARQIVCALLEKGMKVILVTHLYDFASSMLDRLAGESVFLRAERKSDGTRTFKLREDRPLDTSFGRDLYEEIFGIRTDATPGLTRNLPPENAVHDDLSERR